MSQSFIVNKKFNSFSELIEALGFEIGEFDNLQNIRINNEEKNSIGIELVQRVIEWDSKKSQKKRIALIENAGKLTIPAQNSLLKVLEEPSTNSIIVLEVQNYRRLLQTIVSRCKILNLNSSKTEKINFDTTKFFKTNILERERLINDLIETSENKREALKDLIVIITQEVLKKHERSGEKGDYQSALEFCRKAYKSVQYSVNTKLVLNNLLLKLEKI